MEDRQYLPGLERVKSCRMAGEAEIPWLLPGLVALLLLSVFFYWVFQQWLAPWLSARDAYFVVPGLFLLFIGLSMGGLWYISQLVRTGFDFCWKTDHQGLTIRRLLRSRLIPWSAVTNAETVTPDRSAPWLRISSGETETLVPACDEKLVASIWQHLRRFGHSEGVELSDAAKAFWTPIPDDVPHELAWQNPNPPSMWVLWLKLILLVCLLVGLVVFCITESWKPLALAWVCQIINGSLSTFSTRTVRRMVVREDGFDAETGFGTVSLPWERVRGVSYVLGEFRLVLSPVQVLIVPQRDSSVLIKAIVRQLRSLEKPLLVPLPELSVRARQRSAR